MRLGIFGLPQSGKRTLFQLLTGSDPVPAGNGIASGIALIRDDRFDKLVDLYQPKSQAPARIDLDLLPTVEADSIQSGSIFRDIASMDALCHVVRQFQDDAVYHVDGSVDHQRDLENINNELVLHDLVFIEKRLERIEHARKKKADKTLDTEEALLKRCQDHLESNLHLRTIEFTQEDIKIISGYPFLTRKPMLVVLNVGEEMAGNQDLALSLQEQYQTLSISFMQVSASLEQEISELESDEEKTEFMNDAGISESALIVLSRLAMSTLNLISFFTVGTDEVKQWLVRRESTAPEAAGVIHSDIQRGFIRAEMMKYDELVELGSEDALKKAGKFHVMGKDYIVQDGDILSFRFNV